jgi:ABC-type transport system involved in multi-copper enzyme maturation permease subunit
VNASRDMARYEWIRLASLRSTRVVLVGLVAWAVVGGVGAGATERITAAPLNSRDLTQALLGQPLLTGFAPLVAVAAAIFGAGAVSQELRYGSMRMLLVAQPRRVRVILIKVAMTGLIGVVAAIAAAAVAYASSLLLDFDGTLKASPSVASLAQTMAGYLGVVICWAALSVGLTALLGNRVRALMVGTAWIVAAEPLLGLAAGRLGVHGAWADLLSPGGASRDLLGSAASLAGDGGPHWWPALPILLTITAVVLAAGLQRFRRAGV